MDYNGAMQSVAGGFMAMAVIRIMNGLSTYVFSDTIGNLAVERFGGVN